MKKISCIVPAYNEGKRIANVLNVAAIHPLISEVIVIDDGSADNTKEVIEEFAKKFPKVKPLIHEKNKGKSASLYDALKVASGDYVFFLDSDLVGLTDQNIVDLASPIINDVADVSLSLRRNAPKFWHWLGIDYISGERILPIRIFDGHLEDILHLKPFGFEVFLNALIIKNKSRIKIVPWLNVDSPYKAEKAGLWKGIKGDFFMMMDIFGTVSLFGPIFQIYRMKKLMIE